MTQRGAARGRPTSASGPAPRPWRDRLGDPTEPLYTIAVAIDLLGTDHQTLRRLEAAIELTGDRPSGNQRRYSREDLEALSAACDLSDQGFSPAAAARVLLHEHRASGARKGGRSRQEK